MGEGRTEKPRFWAAKCRCSLEGLVQCRRRRPEPSRLLGPLAECDQSLQKMGRNCRIQGWTTKKHGQTKNFAHLLYERGSIRKVISRLKGCKG